MISEVPLGCYLSGGIDSSSVTVTAARLRRAHSEAPLHVFTGVFADGEKYTELPCAEAVAKSVDAKHHVSTITPEQFTSSIGNIIYALDEPRVGMGAFPQYHVSQLVSDHVTVVLTGHGGDELFAGYPLYKARLLRSFFRSPKAALQALARVKPSEIGHLLYYLVFPIFKPEVGYGTFVLFDTGKQRTLLTKAFQRRTAGHDAFGYVEKLLSRNDLSPEARVQEIYLRTYLPSLFIVEDKVGMAHSIEARTPLCDNSLLDFSQRVPLTEKLHGGELKSIPKDALRAELPSMLYTQPKKGFPTPLSLWFRGPLYQYVHEVFASESFARRDVIEPKAALRLLTAHAGRRTDGLRDYVNAARIWSLLSVELWFRIFIDGEAAIRARGRS